MGMESSGLSVADALALQDRGNDNGGMGGGSGMWMMMFLFFILAMGGNGLGGIGGGNAATSAALTRADLCESFNFNNVENGIRGLQSGICDSTFALNNTMTSGFYGIQSGMCSGFNGINQNINQARFDAQSCCCETNRNIDSIRFENAKNTCDIVNAIRSDGDATRALITQNTIQELRDNLQAAQLTLSNANQTQTLVNELRPCARPAYITCSPYTTSNVYGGCCANV